MLYSETNGEERYNVHHPDLRRRQGYCLRVGHLPHQRGLPDRQGIRRPGGHPGGGEPRDTPDPHGRYDARAGRHSGHRQAAGGKQCPHHPAHGQERGHRQDSGPEHRGGRLHH